MVQLVNNYRDNKGRFTKETPPYWLGKNRYPETIEKQRKALIGRKHTEEHKKKISESMIGKKKSLTMRVKLSATKKGKLPKGLPQLIALNKARKGTKMPLWIRQKLSEASKGEKGNNWKGGITSKNHIIRASLEYRLWRESVFIRDNWTCQFCLKRGGNIEADHIKSFAYYPELRFSIDNGRTLCKVCHRTTQTWGNKKIKHIE